jgi:type I restriction enzyme S subunit
MTTPKLRFPGGFDTPSTTALSHCSPSSLSDCDGTHEGRSLSDRDSDCIEGNIPQLRFPGFSGEWAEKRLGEVATMFSGGTPTSTNKKYYSGNIPFIGSGKIGSYFVDQYISEEALEKSSAKLITKGDLLYALYGATSGEVAISKIDGAVNQAVLCIKTKQNIYFLSSWLRMKKKSITKTYLQGGQGNLSAFIVKKLKLFLPSLPEQQKIADFLTEVDNKIQSLTQKKEALTQYKKGVLQQLFPPSTGSGAKSVPQLRFPGGFDTPSTTALSHCSPSSLSDRDSTHQPSSLSDRDSDCIEGNIPQLRFPGFTEPWVEKRLGEVFEITRGNVLATSEVKSYADDIYKFPVFSSQTKNTGSMGFYNKFLFSDAITWTTDGANAGDTNFRKGKFYCTNVCGVLLSNEGFANQCIAEMINKVSKKYVSYVGNPKLMNGVMSQIKLHLPSLPEQQKIADFLTTVDTKITHVDLQIKKMTQFKKGLLGQMFV